MNNRCKWAEKDPLLQKYHDEEWGVPVHDDRELFMLLVMESMSCGLSWLIILKKRDVLRKCFADFDYEKVARFSVEDTERMMNTEKMIRSKSKIEAMTTNAKAFIKIREEFGTFDHYIWNFTKRKSMVYPSHRNKTFARNALSDKIAKDMKKRGFKYVGTVIIYSYLQAIGIIDDHFEYCFKYHDRWHNLKSF
nr:DNA-3-methyladenine glycosylase I [uncultured Prevotella sp.]